MWPVQQLFGRFLVYQIHSKLLEHHVQNDDRHDEEHQDLPAVEQFPFGGRVVAYCHSCLVLLVEGLVEGPRSPIGGEDSNLGHFCQLFPGI
jgi:hypothetical protein